MAFIDTPRTDIEANLTFLNGKANAIDDMSMEASFVEPKKRDHNNLVEQMRKKRNPPPAARTPSARSALNELSNRKTTARRSAEFTPLLKSATKRNASKALEDIQTPILGKENYRPGDQMPQFLKDDLARNVTPLTKPDFSFISRSSSVVPSEKSILRPPDSSGYSTPMHFPGRGDGALGNGRNIMNLKEQERLVDKIEKENFGLKLKIHFLEQRLAERDPDYNEKAIKENGQLKIDRAMMQKELSKIRKQLARAEKEAELLRRELQDAQASAEREEEMQKLEDECNTLQATVDRKEAELERKEAELEKVRTELEDVQAAENLGDTDTSQLREKLEAATEAQTEKVNELNDEIARLRDEREAKDDEIADLRAELDATDNTQMGKLDDLVEEIARCKELLESNNDEIGTKDDEIARLSDEIARRNDDLSWTKEQLASRDKDITLKNEEISRQIQEIDSKEKELASQDHELTNLRAEMKVFRDSEGQESSSIRAKFEELLASKDAELASARRSIDATHSSKDQELADVRISYEASLDSQKAKVAESARQVSSLEDACNAKDEEIRELQAKLKHRVSPRRETPDHRRAELERKLQDRNAEIDELNERWNKTRDFIDQATTREEELCEKIRIMRQERNEAAENTSSAQRELLALQERYDDELNKLRQQQPDREREESRERRLNAQTLEHTLDEARKQAREEGAREAQQQQLRELQKRHDSEMKGLRAKLESRGQALLMQEVHEKNNLLRQYGEELATFKAQRKEWEQEKARVRFVNTSMSSEEHHREQMLEQHGERYQQLKRRYKDDMSVLSREIKWLRARAEREEGFRAALAHEKTYLLAQAENYAKYNKVDLDILQKLSSSKRRGAKPRSKTRSPLSKFAAAAHAVRFTVRLQHLAGQWAEQVKDRPVRKTAQMSGIQRAPPRLGD